MAVELNVQLDQVLLYLLLIMVAIQHGPRAK